MGSFIELLQSEGVHRYLEIGARHGDTFFDVVRSLPRVNSEFVAVDLPGGNWGQESSRGALLAACMDLQKHGHKARCLFGDSHGDAISSIVCRMPHFDAVLIDGDHLYEGVKKDWEIYRHKARIVAFHDIAGDGELQKSSRLPVEVPRLWREIKDQYRHVEFIEPGSKMGIGVLWMPAEKRNAA